MLPHRLPPFFKTTLPFEVLCKSQQLHVKRFVRSVNNLHSEQTIGTKLAYLIKKKYDS